MTGLKQIWGYIVKKWNVHFTNEAQKRFDIAIKNFDEAIKQIVEQHTEVVKNGSESPVKRGC